MAEVCADACRPFFLNVSVVMADLDNCSLHLKAWVHTTCVRWELRRPLISMGLSLAKGVCKIVRQARQVWEADLSTFGFVPPCEHLVGSRRMAHHSKRPLHSRIHEEVSTSTECLLLILLRYAESRRRAADRFKARALLATVLASLLGSHCGGPASLSSPSGCLEACVVGARPGGVGPAAGGVCIHAQELGRKMKFFEVAQTPAHVFLAELLANLFAESADCECLRRWCTCILQQIRQSVDAADFSEQWSDNALKHGVLPGGQERRRVDEDLRRQVSVDVVSKKMATSASRWCQASGELSEQLGDTFDNRSCREYVAAGMLSMSKGNNYSIAFDAFRLGEPAVETNLYLLWSRSAGRSMWLAPQAI